MGVKRRLVRKIASLFNPLPDKLSLHAWYSINSEIKDEFQISFRYQEAKLPNLCPGFDKHEHDKLPNKGSPRK